MITSNVSIPPLLFYAKWEDGIVFPSPLSEERKLKHLPQLGRIDAYRRFGDPPK